METKNIQKNRPLARTAKEGMKSAADICVIGAAIGISATFLSWAVVGLIGGSIVFGIATRSILTK